MSKNRSAIFLWVSSRTVLSAPLMYVSPLTMLALFAAFRQVLRTGGIRPENLLFFFKVIFNSYSSVVNPDWVPLPWTEADIDTLSSMEMGFSLEFRFSTSGPIHFTARTNSYGSSFPPCCWACRGSSQPRSVLPGVSFAKGLLDCPL